MPRSFWSKAWPAMTLALLGTVLLAQDLRSAQGKAEDEVRDAFTALQGALKAKDAAKVWALIDSDTQADAEKNAKKVKSAYKKASDKEKADHEKGLGLTADDFAKLDGQLLLKTKRFLGKYDEIITSKITGVTVQGDSATVDYLEADGDKVKAGYTRQQGKWKVALPMPTFTK
jgi:hypothetical protein